MCARASFFLMILLGVVSFCAVAGMLVKLMLVDHDYYEAKAIRNQTRSTSVTASRGTIYDRNGNVLAASSSVENVFLDPLELSQNKVDVPALAKKLAAVPRAGCGLDRGAGRRYEPALQGHQAPSAGGLRQGPRDHCGG